MKPLLALVLAISLFNTVLLSRLIVNKDAQSLPVRQKAMV